MQINKKIQQLKQWLALGILMSAIGLVSAQSNQAEVTFTTNHGKIVVTLYNDTPKHRDNFLRLVEQKAYDGLLFHRVIQNFMIQAGDPNSRSASKETHLGDADAADPIPAEIVFPQHYHKRGALAAARQSDEVNPERMSSGSQFYIVWGKSFDQYDLKQAEQRLDSVSGGQVKLTDAIRDYYSLFGGTPHLDGSYTVFGEVVKGLETVYKIQQVPTDEHDRPKYDIVIKKARITQKLK